MLQMGRGFLLRLFYLTFEGIHYEKIASETRSYKGEKIVSETRSYRRGKFLVYACEYICAESDCDGCV